jgi:hypothetical protein
LDYALPVSNFHNLPEMTCGTPTKYPTKASGDLKKVAALTALTVSKAVFNRWLGYNHKMYLLYKVDCAKIQYRLSLEKILIQDVKVTQVVYDL